MMITTCGRIFGIACMAGMAGITGICRYVGLGQWGRRVNESVLFVYGSVSIFSPDL